MGDHAYKMVEKFILRSQFLTLRRELVKEKP